MAIDNSENLFDSKLALPAELDLPTLRKLHLTEASSLLQQGKKAQAWIVRWAAETFGSGQFEQSSEILRAKLPTDYIRHLVDGRWLLLVADAIPRGKTPHWREMVSAFLANGCHFHAAVHLWRMEEARPEDKYLAMYKGRLFDALGLKAASLMEHAKSFERLKTDAALASLATLILRDGIPSSGIRALSRWFSDQKSVLEACAVDATTEAALHVLREAVLERPQESWVWLALARLQLRRKQIDDCHHSLKQALSRASPDQAWCLEALEDLFDALGDHEQADRVLLKGTAAKRPQVAVNRFVSRQAQTPRTSQPTVNLGVPVALISQIQRSGGTLLSQLFDCHPEILAHPDEVKIGRPEKWHWPELDLNAAPEAWLQALIESRLGWFIHYGYSKSDGNEAATERFVFNFDLFDLCQNFLDSVTAKRPVTQRNILDVYFSSYFRAWKDYKINGNERWITGFTPWLITNMGSTSRFLHDYPDGLIISCIRDPFDWYMSARRHDKSYEDIDRALALWKTSTLSALELQWRVPSHIHLLTYEALVTRAEHELGTLARRMNISMRPSLMMPSFLGKPVLPNSSFTVATTGISAHGRDPRTHLEESTYDIIARDALPLYRHAVDVIADVRDGGIGVRSWFRS